VRIVFAAPVFPYPPDSGARKRLLRHMELLSARHECSLVTVVRPEDSPEALHALERYGSVVTVPAPHRRSPLHRVAYRAGYGLMAGVRGLPLDAFYGCPGPFNAAVKRQAYAVGADIVHYDYWFSALGDLSAQPYRRVLLEHDVEYIRRRRQYESSPSPARKAVWLTTERAERRVLSSMDCVLAVTEQDANEAHAVGAFRAVVLPTGVDTDFFCPPAEEPPAQSLVFVGAYSHQPNVDAVLWFCREILPQVRKLTPEVSLSIVGSSPTPDVLALSQVSGVEVLGAVPEVVPHLQSARVAIAPLRVGSGIKGKILEYMSCARAVVTTPIGAEGMGLTSGENIVIADGAEDFARAVARLLQNPEEALRIGQAARRFVLERHSLKKADERVIEIYEKDVWKPLC